MSVRARKVIISVAVLGLTAGCGQTDSEEEAAGQDTVPAAAAQQSGPTDAEIAHIVVTANTIDIEAGELAKDKAQSQEVIDFANRMITDHTGVNEQASQLAGRLNLTPADNATSKSLKSSADQTLHSLQGKTGADFDRLYIDNEVAYHQQVLDAIDKILIPNAQNAELKALLEQTRPAIAAHLDMARKIQGSRSQ